MSKKRSTELVAIGNGLSLPQTTTALLEQSESLSEIDAGDQYLPYYCFNVRLKDKAGEWLSKDVFFHTLREDTRPDINCVLLFLHKTHRYRVFSEGEGSKTICQSLNRIEGYNQEEDRIIKCAECPNVPVRRWQNGNPPACKLCYNFVGIDLDNGEPFIVTAKSTSATPTKRFLNKFYLRKFNGKDLPLFVFQVKIGLESPEGTYSVLAFEMTKANPPAEIERYATLCEELMASAKVDFTYEPPEDVSADSDVPF